MQIFFNFNLLSYGGRRRQRHNQSLLSGESVRCVACFMSGSRRTSPEPIYNFTLAIVLSSSVSLSSSSSHSLVRDKITSGVNFFKPCKSDCLHPPTLKCTPIIIEKEKKSSRQSSVHSSQPPHCQGVLLILYPLLLLTMKLGINKILCYFLFLIWDFQRLKYS